VVRIKRPSKGWTSTKGLKLSFDGKYHVDYIIYTDPTTPRWRYNFNSLQKIAQKKSRYGNNSDLKWINDVAALKNYNHACFADFRFMYGKFKTDFGIEPHKLIYKVNPRHKKRYDYCYDERPSRDIEKEYSLKLPEIKWWLKIAQENKVLPPEFHPASFLDKKTFGEATFSLKGVTSSKLYLYLTAIRYINENPGIIRMTKVFYERGVDFFIALTTAHAFASYNRGHCLIDNSSFIYNRHGYLEFYPVEIYKYASGFKNYFQNKAKVFIPNSHNTDLDKGGKRTFRLLHSLEGQMYISKSLKIDSFTKLKTLKL
jgi:hypothetical protein